MVFVTSCSAILGQESGKCLKAFKNVQFLLRSAGCGFNSRRHSLGRAILPTTGASVLRYSMYVWL